MHARVYEITGKYAIICFIDACVRFAYSVCHIISNLIYLFNIPFVVCKICVCECERVFFFYCVDGNAAHMCAWSLCLSFSVSLPLSLSCQCTEQKASCLEFVRVCVKCHCEHDRMRHAILSQCHRIDTAVCVEALGMYLQIARWLGSVMLLVTTSSLKILYHWANGSRRSAIKWKYENEMLLHIEIRSLRSVERWVERHEQQWVKNMKRRR